jgi:adenylate cyclase
MSREADPDITPLLDGLHGQSREEREHLIRWLLDCGFKLEGIRDSLSPILLPLNRVFGDDGMLVSPREVADSNGVPLELLQRLHRAAGLARVDDPDKAVYARADAESVLPAAAAVERGIEPDQIVLVVRLLVEGLSRVGVAMRHAGLRALLRPGVTELELAQEFEARARDTTALIESLIIRVAWLALRQSFEVEAVSATERATGTLQGGRPITVAFADMVGFTQLGEALPPEELGELAGQLANITHEVVTEPVQFVKTIGDAVMLVSADGEKLLGAVLQLLEAAAGYDLPPLRAGMASGLAVTRAGDWYGSPVNVASRVTDAAPPGSVLVAESARAAIGDAPGIAWSFDGARHLRGISDEVRLFMAGRASGL